MWNHGVMTSYMTSYSPNLADFAICRIWVSFIAFWSVFCIAGSINGVYGYLEVIYSCPGVKVTQGHACHGPFQWLISAVIILTLQLSWGSGLLFRSKLKSDLKSAPTNWLCMTHYVSRLSKVIRVYMRSLTSNDLEWPNFSWDHFLGVLECST